MKNPHSDDRKAIGLFLIATTAAVILIAYMRGWLPPAAMAMIRYIVH